MLIICHLVCGGGSTLSHEHAINYAIKLLNLLHAREETQRKEGRQDIVCGGFSLGSELSAVNWHIITCYGWGAEETLNMFLIQGICAFLVRCTNNIQSAHDMRTLHIIILVQQQRLSSTLNVWITCCCCCSLIHHLILYPNSD